MSGSQPEMPDAIAGRLLERPENARAWKRLGEMAVDDGVAVIQVLRARVEELLSQSPPDALTVAAVLLRAAELVPGQRAIGLRGYANALHYNARYDEARELLLEAIEEFEATGDRLTAAVTRRNLVDVLMYLGDSEGALETAAHARAVFVELERKADLARLENNVGNVYLRLDEYPLARRHYESARVVFEDLSYPLGVGITSFNLGIVEMNANDVEASERNLRIASEAFERAGMALHVADCNYNLAYLLSRRGRFADAIVGLEEARRAYVEIGKPSGPPLCDLDLAEIYLRLDARRNAIEYAERATVGFEALGLEYEAARCGILAGLAHVKQGAPIEAIDRLQRSAETFRRLGNQAAAAAVDLQRGAVEISEGAYLEAIARLRAARDTLESRQLRFLTDLAGVTLARAYLAGGDPPAARKLLEQLLHREDESVLFDQLLRSDALSLLADARRGDGDPAGATAALRASILATESSYAEVPGSDLRVAFFRDRHLSYVELVWDLAEEANPESCEEALCLLEQSRSRSLREAAAKSPVQDDALRKARARLDFLLAREVQRELGGRDERDLRLAAPDGAAVRRAQAEVLRLSAQEASPAAPRPAVDRALFEAARGGEDVLLFYVVGPRGVRALLYDEEGVHDRRLAVSSEELARLRDRLWLHADKLRLGPAYVRARGAALETALDAVLDRLGEALIEPVFERLSGRGVVVVPFGDLHDLPVHAFRVGGLPLVLRAEVGYALSATSIADARRARSHGDARIACGASAQGLNEIEGELVELAHLYTGLERVEPDALLAGLESGGLRGALLHLAAHALYRHHRPIFSGLALGERFLLAHDLERLRPAFDLVVLSGCETGRRRRIPGEECYGLPRALFGSGVRALIGSLWAVDDTATRSFMRSFHAELSGGRSVRRALTETQRALHGNGHPTTTWAAFALLGDPTLRVTRSLPSSPEN